MARGIVSPSLLHPRRTGQAGFTAQGSDEVMIYGFGDQSKIMHLKYEAFAQLSMRPL